jgi:transcriptional regulator with XRE-family HTH domain
VIAAYDLKLSIAQLFGGRLKQRRLTRNMTQVQLAVRARAMSSMRKIWGDTAGGLHVITRVLAAIAYLKVRTN